MRPASTPLTRRLTVIAAVAVFAAAIIGLGVSRWPQTSPTPQTHTSQPAAPASAPDVPARPPEAFPLTVRSVYDGDTIRAQTKANGVVATSNPIRIRLIGVDTPERTPTPQCWAEEARRHLAAMLPEGSTVWAAPDRDTWDHYGRRLFNLWTDDGRFVAHELVAAGDATAIRIRPNVTHYDMLAAAQATAQANRIGRWGVCP